MKRCRYCEQQQQGQQKRERAWVRRGRKAEERRGERVGPTGGNGAAPARAGKADKSAPHLEVPQVVTEGAAPSGSHGRVVQTGRHALGHSLVPKLHPALGVVLAVLGPLFPSRGRGCRRLLLAPHEPVCAPRTRQRFKGPTWLPRNFTPHSPAGQDPTSRPLPGKRTPSSIHSPCTLSPRLTQPFPQTSTPASDPLRTFYLQLSHAPNPDSISVRAGAGVS